MSKIYVTLVLIIHICATEDVGKIGDNKLQSDDLKRSQDNIKNIQDLTKRMPAGAGYLPIEEIIRKTNLTNIQFTDDLQNYTTPAQSKSDKTKELKRNETKAATQKNRPATIKILMRGSDDQVNKISYDKIMKNMHLIDKVKLPIRTKMLLWNTIKSNVPVERMTKSTLKKMRRFLFDIPENDFVYINVTDWSIVKYLGISKIMSRRQAGIIGYVMKHKWGPNIIENLSYINNMKGLICGFSETDLEKITPNVFTKIDASVFANVWSCTHNQLKVLLVIALKPRAYGPLEVWTQDAIYKLGLLVTILEPNDFRKFNDMAFQGFQYDIMEMMRKEQVSQFKQEQIAYLNEKALISYKAKVATIINKENGAVAAKSLDLTFIILIISLFKCI